MAVTWFRAGLIRGVLIMLIAGAWAAPGARAGEAGLHAPSALGAPERVLTYRIDPDWSDRYQYITLPVLTVQIPIWRGPRSGLEVQFGREAYFAFRDPDGRLLEVLHLLEVDVDPGPVAERAALLEPFVLRGDQVMDAWRGEAVEVHHIDRRVEGGVPVLELVATYQDRDLGPALLRVIAIPHPTQRRGLRLVARVALQGREIRTPADAADTMTGWVIERLEIAP